MAYPTYPTLDFAQFFFRNSISINYVLNLISLATLIHGQPSGRATESYEQRSEVIVERE